jgi:hypothetical protein
MGEIGQLGKKFEKKRAILKEEWANSKKNRAKFEQFPATESNFRDKWVNKN